MKTHNSMAVGLLLFSYGIPTSTSFCFSPSSCRTAPPTSSTDRRSSTPHHVSARGSSRHPWARRPRRGSRTSNNCVTEDGATSVATSEEQYTGTTGDLEGLSRSELQALCKKLNLRAVGKTSELLSRVLEHHEQQQRLDSKTITPLPSASVAAGATADADATPTTVAAAAASDVVESLKGATITELLSAVDDSGSASSSSSSSSSVEETPTGGVAAAAAAAEAPPTDFMLEDVRPVFDELSDEQWAKVGQLGQLLTEWNGKMNLISRKDIANVMRRHVVPCLAMAKALNFEDGIYVLDVGTGGGLPGLPLAICFPNVKFTLIDGTGKKITAVTAMAERLGLTNVRTFHVRAEEVHEAFDFVMGRAVTNLPKFVGFIDKNLKPNDVRRPHDSNASSSSSGSNNSSSSSSSNTLQRGVLYMRGEVSEEELAELGARPSTVIPLQRVLEEAGQDGDVGLGGGVDDRGYSSIFHFTSEAIWNRVPTSP